MERPFSKPRSYVSCAKPQCQLTDENEPTQNLGLPHDSWGSPQIRKAIYAVWPYLHSGCHAGGGRRRSMRPMEATLIRASLDSVRYS